MKDFASTVFCSLSPAFDRAFNTAPLCDSGYTRIHKVTVEAGGKAVNVAKNLRAAGLPSVLICPCGEDNVAEFERVLGGGLIRTDNVVMPGAVRENFIIATDDQKCYELGVIIPPVYEQAERELVERVLKYADENTLLSFGGSMASNYTADEYIDMILRCKARGAKVAIDTRLPAEAIIRAQPYFIKPNLDEFAELVGEKVTDYGEIARRSRAVIDAGVGHIIVSLGGDGLIYVGSQSCIYAKVPQVEIDSTVGCGDAVFSGFIIGKLRGLTDSEIARTAAAYGTAAATLPNTASVCPDLVEKFLPQIELRDLASGG